MWKVEEAIAYARRIQPHWEQFRFSQGSKIYRRFLRLLRRNRSAIIDSIRQETGKSKVQAGHEIDIVDQGLRWNLAHVEEAIGARRLKVPKLVRLSGLRALQLQREPWGIVASITPSNVPFGIPAYDILASTLVGNVVILKPHEATEKTARVLVDLCYEAGFPDGVVQVVLGGSAAGRQLVWRSDITKFTGSSVVAHQIRKAALDACRQEPIIECGSSNPAIILPSANLERALNAIWEGRFYNSGQSCNAIKRVIVVDDSLGLLRYQKIIRWLRCRLDEVCQYKNGWLSDISHLIDPHARETLDAFVNDAKNKDACCIDTFPMTLYYKDEPRYYLPTLIFNATPDMKVMYKEVFGPVLPVMAVSSVEEAIEVANLFEEGELLGASIFGDSEEINRFDWSDLKTENLVVNNALIEYALPGIPFGTYPNYSHAEEGLRRLCRPVQRVLVSTQKRSQELHWMPYHKSWKQNLVHVLSRVSK